MRSFYIKENSPFAGVSIRQSGIRESFDCMVIGIEREGERIHNPHSDLTLLEGDLLWVVGEAQRLKELQLASE